MTFRELLDLLHLHVKFLVGLTLLVTVAAAIFSFAMPNVYTASTSMQVISTSGGEAESQLVANDLASLLESGKIKDQALGELGITDGDDFEVTVGSATNSRLIKLSVEGKDSDQVSLLVQQMSVDLSTHAQTNMATQPLVQAGAAAPAASVSGPPRKKYIAYAAIGGFVLALAIVVLREFSHPRVHSGRDASKLLDGVSVIGFIPEIKD